MVSSPRPTQGGSGYRFEIPSSTPPQAPSADAFSDTDEFIRWVSREWAPFVDAFLAWVDAKNLVGDYRAEIVGEHARDQEILGAHPGWHFSPHSLPPWDADGSSYIHDPAADTLVEVTRADYADHRMSLWERFVDDAGPSVDAIEGAEHAISAIRDGDYDTVQWSPAPGAHVGDYGVSEAGIYLTPWNADIWAYVAAFEDDVVEGLVPALMHALYERDREYGIDQDVSVGVVGRISDEWSDLSRFMSRAIPAVVSGDVGEIVGVATDTHADIPDSEMYDTDEDRRSRLARAVQALVQWVEAWPPESRAVFAEWPESRQREAVIGWLRWFASQIQDR